MPELHQQAGLFHQLTGDGGRRRLAIDLMVAAGLAVFLAAVAAFGIPNGFWFRLAYWLVLLPLPVVAGRVAFEAIARARREAPSRLPVLIALIVAATLAAMTLIAVATSILFAGHMEWRWLPRFLLWGLIGNAGVTAVAVLAHRSARPVPTPDSPPAPPALLERLPFPLRGATVLAVESQGHALLVHTDAGTPLIWLGLAEAIEELAPLDGFQVHRSWWVARDAILRTDRAGRGAVLTLANGAKVPVSRARLPLLKEGGFL